MNEQTKEFLQKCKKAGYKYVTIYVKDKRVPITMQIEKQGERKYGTYPSAGDYWGETFREGEDGEKILVHTCKVVAAAPNRRDSGFPELWKICEQSSLTAGMPFRGAGCGESHVIHRDILDKGFYDLTQSS